VCLGCGGCGAYFLKKKKNFKKYMVIRVLKEQKFMFQKKILAKNVRVLLIFAF